MIHNWLRLTHILFDKLVVIIVVLSLIFLYIPYDWNVSAKRTVLNLVKFNETWDLTNPPSFSNF